MGRSYDESTQVGFRLRGMEPPDVLRAPDATKKAFWALVVPLALQRKDWELARGWDKDGVIHPLKPATIKNRKSEVGPTHKTAPRLTPALALSRVRSLLKGRSHTNSCELFWGFDSVTGASFAVILRASAEQGHDVFGLSDAGCAWVREHAWDQWRRQQPAPIKTNPVARQLPRYNVQREIKGRTDLENMDLTGNEAEIRAGFKARTFPGFRVLNARGQRWKPGHGLEASGPTKPPPPKLPKPKPTPKPAPKPQTPAKPLTVSEMITQALKRPARGESLVDAARRIIDQHASEPASRYNPRTGTTDNYRSFDHLGWNWSYVDDPSTLEAAAKTAAFLHERAIPARLHDATTAITFVTKANVDDPHWRRIYTNFTESQATGGTGQITVYKSYSAQIGTVSHESGHNLATKMWGSTSPPVLSDYASAMIGEDAISEYAKNSPSEDWAESCRVYVEDPARLARECPQRFKVIERVAQDADYNG